MGRKHFMSVLGTGSYSECIYRDAESGITAGSTPFVQQAVLELKCGGFKETDQITILVTEKAEAVNWTDRLYTENEIENLAKKNPQHNRKVGEIQYGLGSRLRRTIGKEIEPVRIPNGQTQDEIWELFEIILDQIEDGDEIVFDMTYGLRSLPILFAAVLHYAKVVKQVKVLGIYYGAFLEDGAEIWNMTFYSKIMDWVEAAESFVKYGTSEYIYELYLEEEDNIRNIDVRFAEDLKQVLKGICNLTEALRTSRGRYDKTGIYETTEKNSIQAAYQFYQAAAEKIDFETETGGVLGLLQPLLRYIGNNIKLFCQDNNLDIGLATVQWCIDKNLVVQGYAALEETINTYLCKAAGLDETDWKVRDGIVNQVLGALAVPIKQNQKRDPIMESSAEFRVACTRKYTQLEIDEGVEKLAALDHLVEIADIKANLSDFRNDISHFGFEEPSKADNLQKNMGLFFERFFGYMQGGEWRPVQSSEEKPQKRLHIISALGTACYNRYTYSDGNYEDRKVSSEFALDAVLKLKCKEYLDGNIKISVLVTEKALEKNGDKLKASLSGKLADSIHFVMIEEGKTTEELWKIFETVYGIFEEGDEIYFDVTNGFRSLPLLFLPILNYAAVLKKIEIKGIFYAAIKQEGDKEEGVILDLTPYVEIMRWASGANQFIRYGNCDRIQEICTEYKKKNRGQDPAKTSLVTMIKRLHTLTKSLNTCRGRWVDNKKIDPQSSILMAYHLLEQQYGDITSEDKRSIKPLKELVGKMEKSVSVFRQDGNFGTGMAAVGWYLDKHMVQQGFIALDETITTYICEQEGLDSNSPARKDIVKEAENLPQELSELCCTVRELRNDLQHFGFSKESKDAETFEKSLRELYREFSKISGWKKPE